LLAFSGFQLRLGIGCGLTQLLFSNPEITPHRLSEKLLTSPLLANAAIAAQRVGSWPCAARLTVAAEWPLAHIQGRPCGA
jgi:hypothetical protein